MSRPRGNPYVVGQWVRGQRFYGRADLIDEILNGPRNSIWVLGARRVGKTSLLKQLEFLTSRGGHPFVPVFWDLQGADNRDELDLSFEDAVLDAEDTLMAAGVDVALLGDGLFASLGAIRRTLRARGLTLLLLCDETEELLNLHRQDPALLRKLRRALQSREGIRSVLTSSVRLCELAEQRDDTSPFLHGFSPPLYIGPMVHDEAISLARQDQAPPASKPQMTDAQAAEICRRCDNHPYLIQLVGKREHELGDLDEACRQVANDRMINYFFSVDFELLSATEQSVLKHISVRGAATDASIHEVMQVETADRADALQRLENLGFIGRNEAREYILPSFFLRSWLENGAGSAPGEVATPAAEDDTTVSVRTIDGRYALHEEIGAGATGTVFKARDTLLDSWVAVKLLKPEYTTDRHAVDRVRKEILLSRDIAHPNIVRTYHLATFPGGTYITMQWIDGTTLAKIIEEHGPLEVETSLDMAVKLAAALAAAHESGILHRDLKPGNILIDEGGEPHLADFGLARLIGDLGVTQQGVFVGTPHYASPEQVALDTLDERSDIYSLGLVIFEMATGERPFTADSTPEILAMHRSTPPPDAARLRPELPGELVALITRCLAKDPADRVPSAKDLTRALERIAGRI
jgi:RIO-like serine/threonine protein kinase